MKGALAGALISLLVFAPGAAAAVEQAVPESASGAAPATPQLQPAPDRVIVQWAPGADRTDRVSARADADVALSRTLGDADFQLVKTEPGQSVAEAIDALEDDPAVVVAERDGYAVPHGVPNDPLFDRLWGLRNLGGTLGVNGFLGPLAGADVFALGGWVRTVGSPSTVVAVIDSGYRFEHPDLAAVAWTNPGEIPGNSIDDDSNGIVDDIRGADFVGPSADVTPTTDNNPADDNLLSGGHGVHTAGTIAAAGNNGVGITGVAQNVRVMPLRVCANSPANSNQARCPVSSQVAAINYAGAKGARVANISLGGTSFQQTVVNAIAANHDTLYVISAGNDGANNDSGSSTPPNGHHYPCDYRPTVDASPVPPDTIDNIVCVAATNQADGLAGFSDYGAISVDLGAPGTETLSTYMWDDPVEENFEAADFATKWTATGANGGFGRTNESPLTSFGMSDSPGAAPIPNTERESTSAAVTIPAGYTSCTLWQRRTLSLGTGTYTYRVLLNDSQVFSLSPTSQGNTFTSLGGLLQAGGQLQLEFRYTSGAGPLTVANGVWLDDIRVTCAEPVGTATSYEYLQGTSMAAPHVSGAAALLFSYKPSATVTEVRTALLGSVKPVGSLTGKTVTGGRLDVSAALDVFDVTAPGAPQLAIAPAGPANDNAPRVTGSAEELSTVRLYAGASCSGLPLATVSAAQMASPGVQVSVPDNATSTFSARATDTADNASSCSSPVSYTEDSPSAIVQPLGTGGGGSIPMPKCVVPKLAKLSLAKATVALKKANCRLGKVTKPKRKKGLRKLPALIVKSSSPKAGAELAAGAKVTVKLGPKPKPKKRKRR